MTITAENWSYSEEKPHPNTDPNDEVKEKKEKPNMVGVLEMVRHIAFLSKCIYFQIKVTRNACDTN